MFYNKKTNDCMRFIKLFFTVALIFTSFLNYSQEKQQSQKVKVSGKVVDKISNQPLEYTSVSLTNTLTNKVTAGGITDDKGNFSFDASPGTYDIKVDFISFKPLEIKGKVITGTTNLGTITLQEDSKQIEEVVIRSEKTTVEIKLDKKVYNVGQDLMVKGGTVSDVLDNIPSVTVDAEGTVSLRGNENVRILIDGKPSNAINVTDALKLIPADAIDKVEVVTNPSARYDAEGGGGILNIVLKKGKTNGLNGTIIATTGYPDNHGLSGTINYKTEQFNLFTTQGYNYRDNPGNGIFETEYLNDDNTTSGFIDERRTNTRLGKGYNGNFGFDWYLDDSTTWSNALNYRKNSGDNRDNVFQDYFDASKTYLSTTNRINQEDSNSENVEFTTGLVKKFKRDGHKLTIDGSFSQNMDLNTSFITDSNNLNSDVVIDETLNDQKQNRNLIQTDYVLPFGKGSQFEAGYRGDFSKLTTKYAVFNDGLANDDLTDVVGYKENVNALYTQFGTKVNKFSFLFGLRWEDSNITISSENADLSNNKKYNNFFPSAFTTYELNKESSISLSYSKRIQRPRGRQIIPFNNLSSNINTFIGNPDLNPSMTDAIDFGYLTKIGKVTLSTSLYVNKTNDVIQMVRKESGLTTSSGIPLIVTTPVNLATEYRTGFEFTLNYSPYKWWKLNSNFNFFNIKTEGDYTYTNFADVVVTQNFDNTTSSWFARLNSKISLPYKIDWQTNLTYNGPQNNRQGRVYGIFAANLAFSKDVLKDKATVALSVNDLLNSRKRIFDSYSEGEFDSHTEMQWRERQITLSFTYRFNKSKNDKEKPKKSMQENGDGGGEF